MFIFHPNLIHMERIKSLDDYLKISWNLLFRAAITRKGDFQKGMLTTLSQKRKPSARIVVLREVVTDKRQLIFFTDVRSPKVEEMKQQPEVGWLFWDESRKLQIRMNGSVSFHASDSYSQQFWDSLPIAARKSYATTAAPSGIADMDTDGLPNDWEQLTKADTNKFYPNFLVVTTKVDFMQCLHLHQKGHQHAQFRWQDGYWQQNWLVP